MSRPRLTAIGRALAAIVLASACCIPTLRADDQAPSATVEAPWGQQRVDLAKLFDSVVDTVDRKFFDEALLKRIDWRERAKAVRPSVLAAATTDDAVREINSLLRELKTSHTGLFTPDDYEYYILPDVLGWDSNLTELTSRYFWGAGPTYPGIGVFTREVNGRHFVDGVMEGSPAARAGLRYGDEILAVDNLPYSRIMAFRGKIGTQATLTIRRDASGEPQRLDVAVVAIRPTVAFAAAMAASTRIIEQAGSRIGYIHIWSSNESNTFASALQKLEPQNIVQDRLRTWGVQVIPNAMTDEMREMMKPPKPLDFLIVDMRGRVGGNIAVANKYLELLDARQGYWGHERVVGRSNPGRPGLQMEVGGRPRNPPFRDRSALLIDEHTRSAAEIMAYGYKRSAFGPLIGTPTAGAVTSGSLFVMPGDLMLYVAVAGHELNGKPLEGVGVTPDHRVERPLAYAGGADPVLDAAVELLAKQTPK